MGKVERHFWNAGGVDGPLATAWELFYDYHCLKNDEIIYLHAPSIVSWKGFGKLNGKDLEEIDSLAELMLLPDENFIELSEIWRNNKRFRIMTGGVL